MREPSIGVSPALRKCGSCGRGYAGSGLAGSSLDAPPQIFRWLRAEDAPGNNSGDEEAFVWLEGTAISPEKVKLEPKQAKIGKDQAETITFLTKKKLAIGYDAPSDAYLADDTTLKADVVTI